MFAANCTEIEPQPKLEAGSQTANGAADSLESKGRAHPGLFGSITLLPRIAKWAIAGALCAHRGGSRPMRQFSKADAMPARRFRHHGPLEWLRRVISGHSAFGRPRRLVSAFGFGRCASMDVTQPQGTPMIQRA